MKRIDTKNSVAKNNSVINKKTTKIRYYDYSLLAVLICLICFGLVMLYSTSAYSALVKYSDSMHYFKRQLIFTLIGLFGMHVISKIHYHWYYKWAKSFYYISIVLMALVQTPLLNVNPALSLDSLPAYG